MDIFIAPMVYLPARRLFQFLIQGANGGAFRGLQMARLQRPRSPGECLREHAGALKDLESKGEV